MYKIQCRVCKKDFYSKLPQYKQCSRECAELYKKSYGKEYQEVHKEQISKKVKERHTRNPEQRKKYARISYLNQHGATEKWYSEKMVEQNDKCALCEKGLNDKNGFHIDHKHSCCDVNGGNSKTCGKCNRGLLCSACNVRLGYLENILKQTKNILLPIDGTWLFKALKYIEDYDIV